MNDAQSAKIMKESGAIGGMDDENPDPKQMGALMRKMCEVTGEKWMRIWKKLYEN